MNHPRHPGPRRVAVQTALLKGGNAVSTPNTALAWTANWKRRFHHPNAAPNLPPRERQCGNGVSTRSRTPPRGEADMTPPGATGREPRRVETPFPGESRRHRRHGAAGNAVSTHELARPLTSPNRLGGNGGSTELHELTEPGPNQTDARAWKRRFHQAAALRLAGETDGLASRLATGAKLSRVETSFPRHSLAVQHDVHPGRASAMISGNHAARLVSRRDCSTGRPRQARRAMLAEPTRAPPWMIWRTSDLGREA